MKQTLSINVNTDDLTLDQVEQAITAMFGRQSFNVITEEVAPSFRSCLFTYLGTTNHKPALDQSQNLKGEINLILTNCLDDNGTSFAVYIDDEDYEEFDDRCGFLTELCGTDLEHLHGLAVLILFGETLNAKTKAKLLNGKLTVDFISEEMAQEIFSDYPKFVRDVLNGHKHEEIKCDVEED